MQVIHGNRLETLADRLACVLAEAPLDPMTDEIIVVQNPGMQRWVSLALAARNRVIAKCAFPFPVAFFDSLARDFLVDTAYPDLVDLDALAFRIMGLLPALRLSAETGPINRYLGDAPDDLKVFQLSRRIARTFDQYAVYRPEMVRAWDKGGATHWQACLWRRVFPNGNHRAARLERLQSLLDEAPGRLAGLPRRVSVFGIANLPPVFVDLFAALSRHLPVTVYFLNPCREYWGDLLSDREQRRVRQWTVAHRPGTTPDDLHLTPADRILAAFGSAGRDFFDRLAGSDATFEDAFAAPGRDTLLSAVQQGMLDLAPDGGESPVADGTIQVDACHTPLRSVEVLRDRLLALFDADPTLSPHDVIVMTPAIDIYAPLIKAVFEGSESPRIPVSVGDRSLLADSGSARALLRLLTVGKGRLGASEVMGLLDEPAVRRRFGIGASEVSMCLSWVRRSGTRWGVDGPWRSMKGAAPVSETTWRAGVDRLMAGFVMGGFEGPIQSDIVPVAGIGDDQGDVLAAFLDFLDAVMDLPDRLASAHSPGQWYRVLNRIMDDFLDLTPETEDVFRRLGRILESLAVDIGDSAPDIGLDAILDWLDRRCRAETVTGGFGAGGVTCCAMVPMRAVPARVICVLGLDVDAFPRQDRTGGFDLMAKYPRVGDRSQRLDDLYLFLETLLSAQQIFYLSYVYKNIQDNTIKPPSVVVGQLLDALESQYGIAEAAVVTYHYLHGISPAYFRPGSPIQSFDRNQCIPIPPVTELGLAGPILSGPLPVPEAKWRQVEIEDLCRFFKNPARFLIARRLGMTLVEPNMPLVDDSPIALDGLDRYHLGTDLLTTGFTDGELARRRVVHRAEGRLPDGAGGDILFDQVRVEAARLLPLIPDGGQGGVPPVEWAWARGPYRLTGWVPDLAEHGQVIYRFGPLRGTDWVDAWIRHLAVCLARARQDLPITTLVGFSDGSFKERRTVRARLRPAVDAAVLMENLLNLYWLGLREPLPFFPETSYTFIKTRSTADADDLAKAWAAAGKKWSGNGRFGTGEADDPYIRLCFRNVDLNAIAFEPIADAVVGPILAHRIR